MEELVGIMEEEVWLLYKDYVWDDSDEKICEIIVGFKCLLDDELLDVYYIVCLFGYLLLVVILEDLVVLCGYWVLNKILCFLNVIIYNFVD